MVIAESYNIIKGQIRKRLHNVKQNDFKMKVQFVKKAALVLESLQTIK